MLNRFSYIFLLGLIAIAAFLFIYFSADNGTAGLRYVGAERCGVCHEAASLGGAFKVWKSGPHAQAFNVLASDSARAYLAGHADRRLASCLGCHTTLGYEAHNEPERLLNAEGVSCERCHGAGSGYSDYNIMLDRAAFTAHGGVVGTLRDCYQCHAADPAATDNHCPFQQAPFSADSAWPAIRHPLPPAGRRPDTVLLSRTP